MTLLQRLQSNKYLSSIVIELFLTKKYSVSIKERIRERVNKRLSRAIGKSENPGVPGGY